MTQMAASNPAGSDNIPLNLQQDGFQDQLRGGGLGGFGGERSARCSS
jgi:hypothetical protein